MARYLQRVHMVPLIVIITIRESIVVAGGYRFSSPVARKVALAAVPIAAGVILVPQKVRKEGPFSGSNTEATPSLLSFHIHLYICMSISCIFRP